MPKGEQNTVVQRLMIVLAALVEALAAQLMLVTQVSMLGSVPKNFEVFLLRSRQWLINSLPVSITSDSHTKRSLPDLHFICDELWQWWWSKSMLISCYNFVPGSFERSWCFS